MIMASVKTFTGRKSRYMANFYLSKVKKNEICINLDIHAKIFLVITPCCNCIVTPWSAMLGPSSRVLQVMILDNIFG